MEPKKDMQKFGSRFGSTILVLTFCVICFTSFITIGHMQGNARVINYIGIVRGATQRLVKQELNDSPNDELITYLDGIIHELSTGNGEHNLIALPDKEYQQHLVELDKEWHELKEEIEQVRQGQDKQKLFDMSEEYFVLADATVSSAEAYSEKQVASALITLVCLNIGFIVLGISVALYARRQKHIRKALDTAEKASEAKSKFLSSMSHEIRTPMNGIIGMTEIARKSVDDREMVLDCLKKIDLSSSYLLTLINDILDMSRIESGKTELEQKAFELAEILERIYVMFRQRAEEKEIEFTVRCDDLTTEMVIGDELRISQILVNIISNALKFTQAGGRVTVDIHEKEVTREQVTLEFSISDTGIGISEEFQKKLFEPFEQERDNTSRQYGGTGLGLAISHSFVQMMHGEIVVESRAGSGTKFIITLPLKRPDVEQKEKHKEEELTATESFQRKSGSLESTCILLAEDNAINAEIVSFMLENNGAVVDIAANGQEAVDKFSESPENYYKMILMDIQMPVLNGLEASQSIRGMSRRDAKEVQIIGLSANAFIEDINKAKSSGMNDYLTKPLDMYKLEKVIERAAG